MRSLGFVMIAVALMALVTRTPINLPLPDSQNQEQDNQEYSTPFAQSVNNAVPSNATKEDRERWAAMLEQFGTAIVTDDSVQYPAVQDTAQLSSKLESVLRYRAGLAGSISAWPEEWGNVRQVIGREIYSRLGLVEGQPGKELTRELREKYKQILNEAASGIRN